MKSNFSKSDNNLQPNEDNSTEESWMSGLEGDEFEVPLGFLVEQKTVTNLLSLHTGGKLGLHVYVPPNYGRKIANIQRRDRTAVVRIKRLRENIDSEEQLTVVNVRKMHDIEHKRLMSSEVGQYGQWAQKLKCCGCIPYGMEVLVLTPVRVIVKKERSCCAIPCWVSAEDAALEDVRRTVVFNWTLFNVLWILGCVCLTIWSIIMLTYLKKIIFGLLLLAVAFILFCFTLYNIVHLMALRFVVKKPFGYLQVTLERGDALTAQGCVSGAIESNFQRRDINPLHSHRLFSPIPNWQQWKEAMWQDFTQLKNYAQSANPSDRLTNVGSAVISRLASVKNWFRERNAQAHLNEKADPSTPLLSVKTSVESE